MSSLVDDPSTRSDDSSLDRDLPTAQPRSGNEIYRKILHMLPGFLPFLLALLPHDDPPDWIAMTLVVLITVVLTSLYILMRTRVSRPDEQNFYSTTLSYPAAVLGTLLVFPSHAEFAMVVVILIAFGDGFAFICGKNFGKRRLPWNSEKTWAGTIGFVLFSTPIAALAFWLEAQNPDVPFLLAGACCLIASITAALAESWPTKLTDNLRVGLTAALTISTSYFLLSKIWV
ncbi:MAG: phosphatidate cytidylyltransferase [Planctomycetaceae bacterium]|nr:phosphatidate cytidylyltransferase [Planctomycetaceae bacterium]